MNDTPLSTDGVSRRAVRGIAATGAAFVGNRAFFFISTIFIARLLEPEQLGSAYAVIAVVSFVQVAVDAGIGAAVVAGHDGGSLRAVAAINFGVSALLGGAVALLAPWLSDTFGSSHDANVFRLGAAYLVVRGASKVHLAVLDRGLEFVRRSWIDLASAFVRLVATVALVLGGTGGSSLIWGMVVGEASSLLLLVTLVRLPPVERRPGALRDLAGFSTAVVIARLSGELVTNADYLIVSARLGTVALGYYSIAYRVPELMLSNVYWIASSVLYPVLARVHRENGRTDKVLLSALGALGLWGSMVGCALVLVAPDAITTMFGSRWHAATTPMTLVAVALGLHGLVFAVGDDLKASGRVWFFATAEVASAAVTVTTLLAVASRGIVWVAAAHVAIALVWAVASLVIAVRVIGLQWAALAAALRPAATTVVLFALFGTSVRLILAPGVGRLAVSGAVCCLIVLLVVGVTDRARARELTMMLRRGA